MATNPAPAIVPELGFLPQAQLSTLIPLQGELKDLTKKAYRRLHKSLVENGIFQPFVVWQETGRILDGHQRQRVMLNEGWDVPVPVLYVSAKDERDAKQKLLAISSQYGKVTQAGWDAFTYDLDEDWLVETVQFDALPFVFDDWKIADPGTPPTLDELADEHGDPEESRLWPEIRIKVPRAIYQQWVALMEAAPVEGDALKVQAILNAVDGGALAVMGRPDDFVSGGG